MSDGSVVTTNAGTRIDDQELSLAEATSRIKAIKDMMHPLLPLADQVAALTVAIQAQTERQQLLHTGLPDP
jgi:hypothetical protein